MTGIRSFETSRYVVGYLLRGRKHIYYADQPHEVVAGDIFFLARGTHYVEDIPDARRSFEQILFFYTPDQIGHIIAALSIDHDIDTGVRHSCDKCMVFDHVVAPGWKSLKYLVTATTQQLRDGFFLGNPAAETLTLALLIQQIISRPECCLRTRVLNSTDPEKELIERQINEFVFMGISLAEFAERNNRSLSSFKKKFKDYFNETPHKWVHRKRLMHARLMLLQTTKPVNQIASECFFNNSSHFSKSFRQEFGLNPTEYRHQYNNSSEV